jgi:hypothetical protein
VLANADLIARIPLLGLLVTYIRVNVLLATAITLVVAFGARFIVTDRFIYQRRGRAGRIPKAPEIARLERLPGVLGAVRLRPEHLLLQCHQPGAFR